MQKPWLVKHLLFGLLLLSAHSAQAQLSCSALFAPPPTLVQRVQQRLMPKTFAPKPAEAQALIDDVAHAFRKQSALARRSWMKTAEIIASDLANPYKTLFDLHAAAEKTHTSARLELMSLFRALAFQNQNARAQALDRWTRSEDHALALYKIMTMRGLSTYARELDYLREHNVFFSDTFKQDSGALLTYAFEKEGRGKEIAMLYRPAAVSEAAWFKETDDARYKVLFDRQVRIKTFLPANVLAPTSLKPSFIGGFSFDGLGEKKSWEIAHKGYEISLHRTLSQMKEISQLVHETHSFHVHAVFEMRKSDPEFAKFITWFKVLNDALYLRGLEEGLHGDEWVGPVQLPRDHDGSRSRFLLSVESPESVTYQDQKFFSAGLRGRLYGAASTPEFVKLGLELRDTTRSLDQLGRSMTSLSESLIAKSWEKLPGGDRTDYARIITNKAITKRVLLEAGVRADIAERFASADSTAALPFMELETRPLFNFKTGKYEAASQDYIARAETAKTKYLADLKALEVELDGFAAKGETVDSIDLQLAIRQTLTDWARAAKPSERFTF